MDDVRPNHPSPSRRQQLEALEPYTVAEVEALTGFSAQTVTRMFEHEKGTLVINRPTTMNNRRYRRLRIPRAVYERVIATFRVR